LVPNGAPGLESLTVSAIKDWINDHDCEPVRQLSIFDALGVVS
jgi:hypothetical protein